MEELYRFREFLNENTQFRKIFDNLLGNDIRKVGKEEEDVEIKEEDIDYLFKETIKAANNAHRKLIKLPMFSSNPKIPNQPNAGTYAEMFDGGYWDHFYDNSMHRVIYDDDFEDVFSNVLEDFEDFYIGGNLNNFIEDVDLMTFLKELDNSKDLDLFHIDIDDDEIIIGDFGRPRKVDLSSWFISQLPAWSSGFMHEKDWEYYEEKWEEMFIKVLRDQHNSI